MSVERKPLQPGDRFGMLTVIGKDEETTRLKKKQYYFCQCDCGSPIKSIMKASLVSKRRPTYSCGCHSKYTQGYIDNREIALAKLLYGKMKARHVQKLGDTEDTIITFEEYLELIKLPCVYCGDTNSSFVTDRRDRETMLRYNGIDRLDSGIGYRKENVVPACKRCNIAKGELTPEQFKAHLKRIHDFQREKRKISDTKDD